MTRLFIEGREIELDNNVQFAITKQFEELSDPTVIINDWTKTVSIPFTKANHQTFGYIYNPDKATVATNNDTYTGIYFDPLKKLDFKLEWNEAVLMTGYAKMTEIKQSKGKGSYEISLFGTLGKVLQEMSKITFNTNSPDTDYIIDGAKYVSETYNKELIYNSWTSEGQQYSKLYPRKLVVPGGSTVNHPAYHVTDIIGFAPNNSFDNGFDYKSYQTTDATGGTIAQKFTTALENVQFEETTGISPDNVIPNGLMPREIGEYRSYLQLPFIYWNKLFQIFKEKTEEVTGYSVLLDDYWFNDDNPYWHDLVYMLQREKFDEKNSDSLYKNIYHLVNKDIFYWNRSPQSSPETKNYILLFDRNFTNEQIQILGNDNQTLNLQNFSNKEKLFEINIPFCIYGKAESRPHVSSISGEIFHDNALLLNFEFIETTNNNIIKTLKVAVIGKNYNWTPDSSYDIVIPFNGENAKSGVYYLGQGEFDTSTYYKHDAIYNFNVLLTAVLSNNVQNSIKIQIKAAFKESQYSTGPNTHIEILSNNYVSLESNINNRSSSEFILNDLWNKDVKIFDEIIRYCKMFRLSIEVDNINKTISFKPFSSIFDNYTIVDWTSKVDKSRDFNIKPVSLEEKYIIFNNESNKTDLSEKYKNDVGLEYGAYRLITDYEFNNNSKDLFKGCKESITNTDFLLSWTNIHDNKIIKYSLPAEIYVYNKDKDNKFVSNFGAFYFHRGLKYFDTSQSLALRSVIISDDTDFMKVYKNYFYEQYSNSEHKSVTTYPYLDIINDNNLCTFSAPKKSYTYSSEYSYKNGIYENLWADYINERYNIQNKLLSCYIRLNPIDYINFKWNQFVKIGNQVYVVNKIYDYDITSNQSTKVDLIKVLNPDAYASASFKYDYIRASVNSINVPYDHIRKITIEATKNWGVKADDWGDYLSVYPESGGPGITDVYIGVLNGGYVLTFELYDDLGNTIKTTEVSVNVGGTTSIEVDPWMTELENGETKTFTITSTDGYRLDHTNNSGSVEMTISPFADGAGTKTVNITAGDLGYGMTDFYIQSLAGDGDIVLKRGYVHNPYVSFDEQVIVLEPNTSVTITVYNRAASPWTIESSTGDASVTLSPTTGPGAVYPQLQTETLVTITAGNTTGTNVYTFGTTGQPGYNTSKLYVIVAEPEQ